jgi:hypothetical protein
MMKTSFRFATIAAILPMLTHTAAAQAPLGTEFTYQGQLKDGGTPADGMHDFRFRLFDALEDGLQVGATLCADNVTVADGLFTIAVDFGADVFNGDERFLEIEVRADTGLGCGNPAGFVILGPRQGLTAAPNALFALNADTLDGQRGAFYQNASNLNAGTLAAARLPVPLTLSGTSATDIIRGENASTDSQASGVHGLASATSGTSALVLVACLAGTPTRARNRRWTTVSRIKAN